jgi:hypothetical protein
MNMLVNDEVVISKNEQSFAGWEGVVVEISPAEDAHKVHENCDQTHYFVDIHETESNVSASHVMFHESDLVIK